MSQVTLRPSSTLATTAMQVVSGASAHAVLADGADADLTGADTTYVHATGSSACTALMGLPDPSWPAGAVTKSFRLRQRGRAASSTPGQGDVKLFKADAATQVGSTHTYSQYSTTVTTQTQAWQALNLTQAEVNGLLLWNRTNTRQSGPYGIRHVALAVDLILAEKPTAAITTVTTSYTVSSVPVDWSHTPGTDGEAQSHYRVVYLTAAQAAGITGGDPLTAANSIFDSGDVASTTASTLTVPSVPGGVNHVRYVRTAQSINGQAHWSSWVSQTFTVTLTTAEVLSMSAMADTANGRIALTAARDTGKDPWVTVEFQRSAGGSWETVAGTPTVAADTATLYDYDALPGVNYSYRARAVKAGPVNGAWIAAAGTVSWSPDSAWLKVPGDPALNFQLWAVDEPPTSTRSRRHELFAVLDDDTTTTARVVASSGKLGGRSTELSIWTETAAEAAALEAVVRAGRAVLHPPVSWRFQPGEFFLGDLVERTDIPVTHAYAAWRLSLVEVV